VSAAPAPKRSGENSGDDIGRAIATLQMKLKKQWMLMPASLIPGILSFVIAMSWFPTIREKAAANPQIAIAQYIEAADAKAREIAGQQVKIKNRLAALPVKPLREWRDPRIKIIGFMVEDEQQHQIFMLRTLQGLRDLGQLMKGIDEWSYFKYTQIRRLIERSRQRQQSLRNELDTLKTAEQSARERTPKMM